jgi:ABC-type multidrug transport system permease subunit
MLRGALFLARRDAGHMLGRRETLLWTFVMPIVFFYFIGTITGGMGQRAGADSIAVYAPEDAGFLAEHLLSRLAERGYRVARVQSEPALAEHGRRLRLPAGFTASALARRPVTVRFERTGSGLGADYDEIRVSRAVYSILADLIVLTEKKQEASSATLRQLAAQPRNLTLLVEQAGERKDIPSGFEQAVPGTLVMFTILVMFTSGAILLVAERNQGLLRRLASSPMSRQAVVAGKWGARMALGMIQISFGLLAGWLFFHVDWGPHLGTLLAVLVCYGALAASLGMLLGNFARTEGQAAALGVIASNVLAGLGGCWWPIEITPEWVQKLALFLPTGLAMDALHRLVSFGYGPASVMWHLAAMAVAAVVTGAAVARTFRFQ